MSDAVIMILQQIEELDEQAKYLSDQMWDVKNKRKDKLMSVCTLLRLNTECPNHDELLKLAYEIVGQRAVKNTVICKVQESPSHE